MIILYLKQTLEINLNPKPNIRMLQCGGAVEHIDQQNDAHYMHTICVNNVIYIVFMLSSWQYLSINKHGKISYIWYLV